MRQRLDENHSTARGRGVYAGCASSTGQPVLAMWIWSLTLACTARAALWLVISRMRPAIVCAVSSQPARDAVWASAIAVLQGTPPTMSRLCVVQTSRSSSKARSSPSTRVAARKPIRLASGPVAAATAAATCASASPAARIRASCSMRSRTSTLKGTLQVRALATKACAAAESSEA